VIKSEFASLVEAHAAFLKANGQMRMLIQGNTDERGSREYNIALGQKRAEAVKRALVLLGVNEAQVESVSLGEDAVIVGSSNSVADMDRTSFRETFGDETAPMGDEGGLIGTKVYSKAGSEVGVIRDVMFDPVTGRIEGFEISDGLLQDVIQGRKVLPLLGKTEFGREFAVVDNEAVDEMKETGGGIRNRLLGG